MNIVQNAKNIYVVGVTLYILMVTQEQSQKKRKLSGQQDFCRKNFPDKARKSRQFSNSRQMPVKGVLASS